MKELQLLWSIGKLGKWPIIRSDVRDDWMKSDKNLWEVIKPMKSYKKPMKSYKKPMKSDKNLWKVIKTNEKW